MAACPRGGLPNREYSGGQGPRGDGVLETYRRSNRNASRSYQLRSLTFDQPTRVPSRYVDSYGFDVASGSRRLAPRSVRSFKIAALSPYNQLRYGSDAEVRCE